MAKIDIQKEDVLAGLSAVISINVNEPNFDSQAKVKLSGKEVEDAVYSALVKELNKFVNNLSEEEKKIISTKIVNNAKIRQAADVAKIAKKKSVRNASPANLPSNLKDCSWAGGENSDLCELYICEGLSAAGSVVAARNSNFQAVLPIRGKILNVMKLDLTKKNQRERFNNNAEINDIIKALNTGVGEHCDIDKARYGKVVFTCFSGDTEVKCLDGNSYSFKELVDNNTEELWIYSRDEHGNVVPAIGHNIRKTGTTNKYLEIVLDNGKTMRCTPTHFFMDNNGVYKMAKDLSVGESLMPLHCRINDLGYEEYYDDIDNEWKLTYRMVTESEHKDEKECALERLSTEEHAWNQNRLNVHHKDFNKLNNLPENLEYLTAKEHIMKHGKAGLTTYNKSKNHRDRVRYLHKETDVYDQIHFGNNGYNGSELQTKNLKEAHSRGVYKNAYKKFAEEYNYSDRHKEVVANVNKSEKHKISVAKSKIAKVLKYLMQNCIPITESNYNLYKFRGAPRFSKLIEVFGSLESAIIYSQTSKVSTDGYVPSFEFVISGESRIRGLKNKIAKVIRSLNEKNLEVNKTNYDSERVFNYPKWDSITDYFSSIEDAVEYSKNMNHKIVEIREVLVEDEDVYCMTVDKYHNFLLDSGVFVKNCDGDVDGKNINVLLLGVFYRLFRPLIEAGMVYQCTSPFFEVKYRQNGSEKTEYAMDEKERMEIESRLKSNNIKYTLARAKGLGELNADVFHDVTMNPKNRTLIRITMKDAKAADDMLELAIGNMPADARKDWMNNHTDVIDDLGLYS